jgi:hypothetical protein
MDCEEEKMLMVDLNLVELLTSELTHCYVFHISLICSYPEKHSNLVLLFSNFSEKKTIA